MLSVVKQIRQEEELVIVKISEIEREEGKCSLVFKTTQDLELSSARRLIVNVMEKFRERFNKHWELYSRVVGGTINTQNVEIIIDAEGPSFTEFSVIHLVHREGKLYYTFKNGEVKEEDYGAALRSVYTIPFDLVKKLILNTR